MDCNHFMLCLALHLHMIQNRRRWVLPEHLDYIIYHEAEQKQQYPK